jgi:hypothetical protein
MSVSSKASGHSYTVTLHNKMSLKMERSLLCFRTMWRVLKLMHMSYSMSSFKLRPN